MLSNAMMGAVLVALGKRMISNDESIDAAIQEASVADAVEAVPANLSDADAEKALNSLAHVLAAVSIEDIWQQAHHDHA